MQCFIAGSRVRGRIDAQFHNSHVRDHARQQEVGTVTDPGTKVFRGLFVQVRFESCGATHRFLMRELEPAQADAG